MGFQWSRQMADSKRKAYRKGWLEEYRWRKRLILSIALKITDENLRYLLSRSASERGNSRMLKDMSIIWQLVPPRV
jgi:hypothetical protein